MACTCNDVGISLTRYKLREILSFVERHLADSIQVADLAKAASLSPYHFARLFRRAVGPGLACCRSCAHAAALYEAHERCVSEGFAQGGRHDHLNCIRVMLERLDGHRGPGILKVGPKRGRKAVQSPRKPRRAYWSWKRARVRRIPVLAMNHVNEARHRSARFASVRMLSVNEEGNAL